MMLQSAIDLQNKYHAKLPLDFPFVSRQLQTYKELTEQLLKQIEYLVKQDSVIKIGRQSFFDNIPQQEDQMTFNEEQLNFGIRNTDIIKGRFSICEKNINKRNSSSDSSLQHKFDQQYKKLVDLQTQLKEKDKFIEQLQMKLYKKEMFDTENQINQLKLSPTKRLISQVSKSTEQPFSKYEQQIIGYDHHTQRCKVQAEMIEKLIKDKNQIKEDYKQSSQNSQITQIELEMKQLYKQLYLENNKDVARIYSSLNNIDIFTLMKDIKQQVEILIVKNIKENNIKQKNQQQDQLFSNIIKCGSQDFDLRRQSLNSERDFKYQGDLKMIDSIYSEYFNVNSSQKDEKFKALYNQSKSLEIQHQKLCIEHKAEIQKSKGLENTLRQLENIFGQENEIDDNEKKILEEIRNLNQQLFTFHNEVQKENEMLRSQLETLKYSQLEGLTKQQSIVPNNNSKQPPKSNMFKRNTIKKVQGLLQSQLNSQPHHAQTPSQTSFSNIDQSSISNNDCIFKVPNPTTTSHLLQNAMEDFSKQQSQAQEAQFQLYEREKQLLEIEIQNLKEQITKKEQECVQWKEQVEKAVPENDSLQLRLKDAEEKEQNIRSQYETLMKKYEDIKKSLEKMKNSQLELKQLIDEERQAYNEERDKHEEEIDNLQKVADTKIRIFKNKLIHLYDGNVDNAKDITIEEILDNLYQRFQCLPNSGIALQQKQRSPSQKRGSSMQRTTNTGVNPYISENQGINYTQQSSSRQNHENRRLLPPTSETPVKLQNRREQRQIVQSSERQVSSRRENSEYGCLKSVNIPFQRQNQAQQMVTMKYPESPAIIISQNAMMEFMDPSNRTSLQQTPTNYTPRNYYQNNADNQAEEQQENNIQVEEFIQEDLSPIKNYNDVEINSSSTASHNDTKENRIMSFETKEQMRRLGSNAYIKEQQRQSQQTLSSASTRQSQKTGRYQNHPVRNATFLQRSFSNQNHTQMNMNHNYIQQSGINKQGQSYFNKQSSSIHQDNNRKNTASNYNHDMPLQIRTNQNNIQPSMKPISQAMSPSGNAIFQTMGQHQVQQIQSYDNLHHNGHRSQHKNENLSNIIENFKREKTVFNMKFMELKKKLEHFNSPQRSSREHSVKHMTTSRKHGQEESGYINDQIRYGSIKRNGGNSPLKQIRNNYWNQPSEGIIKRSFAEQ